MHVACLFCPDASRHVCCTFPSCLTNWKASLDFITCPADLKQIKFAVKVTLPYSYTGLSRSMHLTVMQYVRVAVDINWGHRKKFHGPLRILAFQSSRHCFHSNTDGDSLRLHGALWAGWYVLYGEEDYETEGPEWKVSCTVICTIRGSSFCDHVWLQF